MNKYTIPCTKEQTKKALELGAPLFRLYGTGCSDYIDMLIISDTETYTIPTSEQMIGWLEDQGIMIDITHQIDGYCHIKVSAETKNIKTNIEGSIHRSIATLAAIDAALDYLTKNKK